MVLNYILVGCPCRTPLATPACLGWPFGLTTAVGAIPVLLINMSVSPLQKVAQNCHSASKFLVAVCTRAISMHFRWILLLKADTFCIKVSYYGQIQTKPTMTSHIDSGQVYHFRLVGHNRLATITKLFSIKIPYYATHSGISLYKVRLYVLRAADF